MPREYIPKTLVTGYVPTELLNSLLLTTGLNRSQLIVLALNALESKLARPKPVDITTIEPSSDDLDGSEYPHLTYENPRAGLDPKGLLGELENSEN